MPVQTLITITHGDEAQQTITDKLQPNTGDPSHAARKLADFFRALAAGAATAKYNLQIGSDAGLQAGGVRASGTVTFASLIADDTVTVGNQTFTAKASPSGNNEFALGANDTDAAANLAAKIEAHPVSTLDFDALAASGVVTVTAKKVGTYGNALTLSSSNGTRAAVVAMANGADVTSFEYKLGVA